MLGGFDLQIRRPSESSFAMIVLAAVGPLAASDSVSGARWQSPFVPSAVLLDADDAGGARIDVHGRESGHVDSHGVGVAGDGRGADLEDPGRHRGRHGERAAAGEVHVVGVGGAEGGAAEGHVAVHRERAAADVDGVGGQRRVGIDDERSGSVWLEPLQVESAERTVKAAAAEALREDDGSRAPVGNWLDAVSWSLAPPVMIVVPE